MPAEVEAVLTCAVAVPEVSVRSTKSGDFLINMELASVRAGCRQVIDVLRIVIENTFRLDNGRSAVYRSTSGLSVKFAGLSLQKSPDPLNLCCHSCG
jgi:hypothetical protein